MIKTTCACVYCGTFLPYQNKRPVLNTNWAISKKCYFLNYFFKLLKKKKKKHCRTPSEDLEYDA